MSSYFKIPKKTAYTLALVGYLTLTNSPASGSGVSNTTPNETSSPLVDIVKTALILSFAAGAMEKLKK